MREIGAHVRGHQMLRAVHLQWIIETCNIQSGGAEARAVISFQSCPEACIPFQSHRRCRVA
eukprot:11038883-Karenia_brevis.AAC.1